MENSWGNPVSRSRWITWLVRSVTLCMLAAMLGVAPATAVTADDQSSDLALLSSMWEDATELEAEAQLEAETALAPSSSDLEGSLSASSGLDSSTQLDGSDTYSTGTATDLDGYGGSAPVQPSPDTATPVLTAADEFGWLANLNGWVPSLRTAVAAQGTSLTGDGVDIALIDSGITPVAGLDGVDKVVNGPDLSGDAATPGLLHLDLFGHGTHMAGIIAGNDGVASASAYSDTPAFTGIAPDARLVNLKVADGYGNTSPEQVVAAIEWAVAHRNDNGLNIRVLALALGHDEANYQLDPIAGALEAAWNAGIVVVVAGGNKGTTSGTLDAPAIDPYVVAVAGSHQGDPFTSSDETVAAWSSSGNGVRNPDITAPGKSIVSLRVPGSYADVHYPTSAVGERFAVASGTSQATAVMAGVTALLIENDETLTPDQVKKLLRDGARSITGGTDRDGEGRVRTDSSLYRHGRGWIGADVQQSHAPAPVPDGFGTADGGWAGGSWNGATWSGGTWSGATWSGATWSGATWSGATWSGATWSGATWSGVTWSGATWSGATWSGATWSGVTWS